MSSTALAPVTAVLGLAVAGCFPGYQTRPRVLPLPPTSIQSSTGPLSYRAPTPTRAAPPLGEVTGRACQSGLTLPLGWITRADEAGNDQVALLVFGAGFGDGGYAAALADAGSKAEGPLYDIRADVHVLSILGVWREQCVEVTAAVGPAEVTPPASRAASRGGWPSPPAAPGHRR